MQIWLGGNQKQTSLARSFMEKVKLHDLEKVLEPLFYYWKQRRQSKESFGDFTNRIVSFDGMFFICMWSVLTLVLIFKMIIMVVRVIGKFGLVTPFPVSRDLISLRNMLRNGKVRWLHHHATISSFLLTRRHTTQWMNWQSFKTKVLISWPWKLSVIMLLPTKMEKVNDFHLLSQGGYMWCCFVVHRNGGWATEHNSLLLLWGNSGDRLN